jgi:hypothetical protein
MNSTQILVIIFCILMFILYVQSYLQPKNDYTIVQTYLDKIKIDTLYEKHPIIIYDHIYDPLNLIKSLFAYSYACYSTKTYQANKIFTAKSKFTLLFNDKENNTIHLISPKYKLDMQKRVNHQNSDVQYITVMLKQNQILILPLFWRFESSHQCRAIELDDFITPIVKLTC